MGESGLDNMYKLYFGLKRIQKKRLEKGESSNFIVQKVLDRIDWYYNVVLYEKKKKKSSRNPGITSKERDTRIIVSLTTYPKRINTIWFTIETLLSQSVKPDKIILWLSRSEFESKDCLPTKLLEQESRGLTIRFCDENLKSHKKYYYVMQEYPNDLVILADDDLIYPRDTVSKLMKMHRRYPEDICTMTAQRITPSLHAKPSRWRNPYLSEKYYHSNQIQIFTGSGSLYPPHALPPETFRADLIQELCPYADDLWLTYMAYRNQKRITACYPWRAFPLSIYGTAQGSLYYINAEEGQNDIQWEAMVAYFENIDLCAPQEE